MTDGKQESENIISSSKLSATVPAFVPGIAYTQPTSPSDLVINSNLSPLVPEFKPSVPFTSYAFPPYYPYFNKQSYVEQDNIESHQNAYLQANHTDFSLSKKNPTKKGKKAATKKIEEQNEVVQNSSENTTAENITDTDSSVKTKKKRHKRKKKEPGDSTLHQVQEEIKTGCLTEAQTELTVATGKYDASAVNRESASSKAKQFSGREQTSATSNISLNSPDDIKDSKTNKNVTATESVGITDEEFNSKQLPSPNFTVSYSDKVKSLASKNLDSHLGTEKSWVKEFGTDSSSVKDKHKQNFQYHDGHGTLAKSLLRHDEMREVQGGKRTEEKRGYHRLKESESSKSQTRHVEQNPRTERQMGRNSSFKKMTCDDDDNWRVRKDNVKVTVDSNVSSRTDTLRNSNIENPNPESLKKRGYQGVDVDGDSKKVGKGSKHRKPVGCIVAEEVGKSVKQQQNSCEFVSGTTANEACTKLSSSGSDLLRPSQIIVDARDTLPVASTNSGTLEGEFPDLRDSVKIKRRSAAEKRTVVHKDMISPPKPSAPMSYSAVLRSPKPKPVEVSPAWESEHPTKQGGLLKVPAQSTSDGVENEGETEGTKQKKKKKKKKKKATGDKPQENTSSKKTEKPIQFDLGAMLQTISISSPDGKKIPKKHVISAGVLPSQLAAASSPEDKPSMKNIQLLKKTENKATHNVLDSTAPVVLRGKERETPVRKKPSALKKIILKEREEKKKAREGGTGEAEKDNESCQDEEDRTCETEEESTMLEEVQSPLEEEDTLSPEPSSPTDQEIAAKIHSRQFREYCFQVPNREVDTVATELLRELVRFQDRQFQKDPVKAKAKRRFVLGLREVSKHLKLKRLKCVIISSNVERSKSAGGLDDTLSGIISLCQEYQTPVVFALRRQLLGRVLLKKVPVSIVGIFSYDGAQDHFKKLIDLTQKTRQAYTEKWEEMKEKLELQQKENQITAEPGKELGADGGEIGTVPHIIEEDAAIQNHQADAIESSAEEEEEEEENCADGHNEKDTSIVENDLEIQEF